MTAACSLLTAEQQAMRMTGVGSSEIAAVAGLSPFSKPCDVWAVKTGLVEPFQGNERTAWGNRLEAVIADAYAEERGVVLRSPGTLRHPRHAFAIATLDRIARPIGMESGEKDYGLEIKNHGQVQLKYYGEDDTVESVPDHEQCQAVWEMEVTGLEYLHLAVLFGGNELRVYRINRDPEAAEALLEAAQGFMRYVERKEAPPVDESTEYSRFLSKRFPRSGESMVPATSEAKEWMDRWRHAEKAEDLAKAAKNLAANQLKSIIGDAAGIEGLCTWKRTKDRQIIDWEAIARKVAAASGMKKSELAEIQRTHTGAVPGHRRFLPIGGGKNDGNE